MKQALWNWFKYRGWLICVLFAINLIPAVFADVRSSVRVFIFLSGFGYWFLAMACWRWRWARIFSILLVLAWCVNTVVSVLFEYEYDGEFTAAAARCVLLTNTKESYGMLFSHWEWLGVGVALFVGMLWLLPRLASSEVVSTRILGWGVVVFGVYLVSLPVIYTLNGRSRWVEFSYSETVLCRTPLYNAAPLANAAGAIGEKEQLEEQAVSYDVKVRESGVDVFVVVIGESARRKHLSLYGYPRATSPQADRERERMVLFRQAIAPAPMTFMAIALSMCKPGDAAAMPPNLADNVVNLASQAGFRTYWLDRDPHTHGNMVDHISSFANRTVFQIGRYDDDIIPVMSRILTEEKGRKLIVVHIIGSHSPYAPSQYPPETAKFSDGKDEHLNNYDNSIYATDAFLGKMFSLLNGHKASVLYYSDHAVTRKTTFGRSRFRHGSVAFPREAVDIPMFIWFSQVATSAHKGGSVDAPYSTWDNYHLISDWLGVEAASGGANGGRESARVFSPLRKGYVPRSEITVLGTDQRQQVYSKLSSEPKEK